MQEKQSQAMLFKEQLFDTMLNVKSTKGVFLTAIAPNGNKIEWLLYPKAIVPDWINSSSLLTYRPLTRDERRMIHKSKINSNDPDYYKRKPVVPFTKK